MSEETQLLSWHDIQTATRLWDRTVLNFTDVPSIHTTGPRTRDKDQRESEIAFRIILFWTNRTREKRVSKLQPQFDKIEAPRGSDETDCDSTCHSITRKRSTKKRSARDLMFIRTHRWCQNAFLNELIEYLWYRRTHRIELSWNFCVTPS